MPVLIRRVVTVAFVLTALLWPTVNPPTATAIDSVTLSAVGDAYVSESRPTSNYGGATTLRVRLASNSFASLVQFQVGGLSAPPAAATLRLYVTDPSPSGGRIGTTSASWSESTITWNNHPAIGTTLAELGPVSSGTWVEVDVTPAVVGNGAVAFYIQGISGNSVVYSSSEGPQAPQLVLETGSSTPPPPPPPAPVASFTATPTSGTAPLAVAFTDTSTNTPTSWAWDFDNDGSTDATAQHPSHTYETAGTYSVRLTATNAGGSHTVTRTDLVTVGSTPPPPPPPGDTVTLLPTGDAFVNEGRPSSNYGSASTLRVRLATDRYASLIRFNVGTLSGPPTSATLRLYVVDDSPIGGRVGTTASTWSEGSVTWGNHPPMATTLAELGPASGGTWMNVDVTSAITGNGTFAFYLEGMSSNSVVYSSREGVQPAQLVLQTGSTSPPPAPVAAFTASPTSGAAPLTVAFTDTSTNSPTSWAWDFDNNGTIDSNSTSPAHTYTAAGTYSVTLTVSNTGGTDSETKTGLVTVTAPPPPPAGSAVMVGAGDIADCGTLNDAATANLLDGIAGTVFTVGDNVEDGLASQFTDCYAPTWGRHKSRTQPAPGNREYIPGDASAYFDYFGAAAGPVNQGWYSYDVGSWHVVVLNTECSLVGGCEAASPQTTWLRADLAASTAPCTMAIFHRPLFTSSRVTGASEVRPLWTELYNAGAELIVNGHAHIYERMAPQTPTGVRDDANGIRQIIAGTGGHQHHGLHSTIHPNSEVRNNVTFGVLKLTLHASSYDWQFVPIAGQTFTDSGSTACH